ncbi:MAG: acyl-CoA dehydrogenase family protein [Phenylobacterium sp.]|uniref:acyl-CoA dehydrogenase family protein n=1 Tax=Phenylobacterium sp. TaxID=1871053 RepID=UPI00273380E9|nr:acyl-CoA dehydrogenase family protein [Phenylobacterium sp.]MDP3175202.1 acyl-CoA dehydrogenase family protein [Phenylobacterium sp.]
MDFDIAPEDDPRRLEIRGWLKQHPKPTARELLDSGYEVPHWPPPYGLSANAELQLIVDEELNRAGVQRFGHLVAQNNCGPSLLTHGTAEAKARYLEKGLMGEELWCQLFSEPSGGSDLAALRTTAVRDGDHYIINGQKIWTSLANHAHLGCIVARTDPHAAKHAGLSMFIVELKNNPGVTVNPIEDMTGYENEFNEVFFDNVRVPATNRLGEEGDGWRLTMQMLGSERVHMGKPGAVWGYGPTARDLIDGLNSIGKLRDVAVAEEAAKLYIEGEMIRLLNYRRLSDQVNAKRPGPESAVAKMLAAPHGQKLLDLAKRVHGQAGLIAGESQFAEPTAQSKEMGGRGSWDVGFWFSPAITLGVGTQEVLKNVVGERLLGLPRELDPSAKGDWSENLKSRDKAA